MFKSKLEKRLALTSLLVGMIVGSYQYLPDINKLAVDSSPVVWEDGAIDAKALASTPPLEAILNLKIPSSSASLDEWESHLDALDLLEKSHKLFGRSNRSNLGSLYAQVALEKPEIIYERLNNKNFNINKAASLLEAGLLVDWYEHVDNTDELLLENVIFTLSYAASQGQSNAKKRVAQAFFTMSKAAKPQTVRLETIAYAYPAMTIQQQKNIIPLLKSSKFKYDPRDVAKLVYLNVFKPEDLIGLIKDKAYSQKSMSSYMSDATLLGDISYIRTFANDAHNNDKQPTNFYCSACTLVISTDGLIGEPLLQAVSENRLKISPQNGLNGEVAILSQGQPTVQYYYE
jgi:hypothetical protein